MTLIFDVPSKIDTVRDWHPASGKPCPPFHIKLSDLKNTDHMQLIRVSIKGMGKVTLEDVGETYQSSPPPFYIDLVRSEDYGEDVDLIVWLDIRGLNNILHTTIFDIVAEWLWANCGPHDLHVTKDDYCLSKRYVFGTTAINPPARVLYGEAGPFTYPAASYEDIIKALTCQYPAVQWVGVHECGLFTHCKGLVAGVEVFKLTKAAGAINTWIADIPAFPVFLCRVSDSTVETFLDGVATAFATARDIKAAQDAWFGSVANAGLILPR